MTSHINYLTLSKLTASERANLLKRTESDLGPFLEKVKPIIEAVRDEGDAALSRFAGQFDNASVAVNEIAATPKDFDRAYDSLEADVKEAIAFAAGNIRKFHELQKPEESWSAEIRPGLHAGDRTTPIPSVACYIPRGKGSFPSSVLMTCIPASVAGVEDICIVTPPGPDGNIDAASLVAARAAGVPVALVTFGPEGVGVARFEPEALIDHFDELPALVARLIPAVAA